MPNIPCERNVAGPDQPVCCSAPPECRPAQLADRALSSFISYRQSYSHHPARAPRYGGPAASGFGESDERVGLMSVGAREDDGDAVIEMDLLPPRWLDVQDDVAELLAEIARKTRTLDQLHQKHVLPGFADEHVKRREERDIEGLTQDITRAFQSCQKGIQKIDMMVRDAQRQGNISNSDEVMARNLKVSLAAKVGDVSATFRKKQAAYLKSASAASFRPCSSLTCSQRTPWSQRLRFFVALSGVHACTEPLQRSRHAGVGRRPLLFTVHSAPDQAGAAAARPQRSHHRAAGAPD